MKFDAAEHIDQLAIDIVINFLRCVALAGEKEPTGAAEHLYISLIFARKPRQNLLAQQTLSSDAWDKAFQ